LYHGRKKFDSEGEVKIIARHESFCVIRNTSIESSEEQQKYKGSLGRMKKQTATLVTEEENELKNQRNS
jgi:hypothetical protein